MSDILYPLPAGITQTLKPGGGFISSLAFNPSDLSGLAAWWDASDSDNVVLNGSNVSEWLDTSGNGRDLTQAVTGSQPEYDAVQINGLSTITFDGIDEFLQRNAFLINLVTYSLFYIIKAPAQVGPTIIGESRSNTATLDTFFQIKENIGAPTDGLRLFFRNDDNVIQTNADGTISLYDDNVHIGGHTDTGGTYRQYVDGAGDIVQSYTRTGPFFSDIFCVGAVFFNSSPVAFLDGDIGEIVIYDRVLNDAEREQVTIYLTNKWK